MSEDGEGWVKKMGGGEVERWSEGRGLERAKRDREGKCDR